MRQRLQARLLSGDVCCPLQVRQVHVEEQLLAQPSLPGLMCSPFGLASCVLASCCIGQGCRIRHSVRRPCNQVCEHAHRNLYRNLLHLSSHQLPDKVSLCKLLDDIVPGESGNGPWQRKSASPWEMLGKGEMLLLPRCNEQRALCQCMCSCWWNAVSGVHLAALLHSVVASHQRHQSCNTHGSSLGLHERCDEEDCT